MAQGARPVATKRSAAFLECGRVLTTPAYSAYIKTGDGCDNRCAYCAIPLIRGRYRSRSRTAILNEMHSLAAQGVREHILIAQDTTRYGVDTNDSLSSLMQAAVAIPGVEWLRALYMYPDETSEQLLDVMSAHPQICKYLDLPLQHASPRLLQSMNRRGTSEEIRALIKKCHEYGILVRTTMIVGFPGETDAQFETLMNFVKESRFERLGAFTYSPEEGTPACTMPDQVDEDVKNQRLDDLMMAQQAISAEINESRIGSVVEALIDGEEDGAYIARSALEAPESDGVIRIAADKKLTPGEYVRVRITGADAYDLMGVSEE